MDEQQFLHALFSNAPAKTDTILVHRGDDAAVVRYGNSQVAVTTDCCIENRHFSFDYFSPAQVGAKAVQGSASDIIAMGGKPQYALWSLVFGVKRPQEFYQAIAAGVEAACARLKIALIGGNLAQGESALQLSMTIVGEIPSSRSAVLRNGARPGDLVLVTGTLGGSAAGRVALTNRSAGFEALTRMHLEPRCRLDLVDKIAPHATSMIDISDGLSHELHLLSEASNLGFEVNETTLPLHPELRRFATTLGQDPLTYVFGGGEDYELLFTLPPEKKVLVPAAVIGTVVHEPGVWIIDKSGDRRALPRTGYDHLTD